LYRCARWQCRYDGCDRGGFGRGGRLFWVQYRRIVLALRGRVRQDGPPRDGEDGQSEKGPAGVCVMSISCARTMGRHPLDTLQP
jgi:hypothetical protein